MHVIQFAISIAELGDGIKRVMEFYILKLCRIFSDILGTVGLAAKIMSIFGAPKQSDYIYYYG